MTERFVLHPVICPSGTWVVTGTLQGGEGQSSSPADEHWCSGCSLPALQPQHSPAGWEAQLAEGWQLQELISSSPAEVDSVSLFILPFTFLVGCLWVLAYWEPESTNPVVCAPIGPNTWLCVSCPVFNIFYIFQRIWNEYYMLYTISYHVLNWHLLSAWCVNMCDLTDTDLWQQISDSRFSKLCFYWRNSPCSQIWKGRVVLLCWCSLLLSWVCQPLSWLQIASAHPSGAAQCWNTSSDPAQRVLGCCPARVQHSSSSKASCQCQSCSHPAPARAPCNLLALPMSVCVFLCTQNPVLMG